MRRSVLGISALVLGLLHVMSWSANAEEICDVTTGGLQNVQAQCNLDGQETQTTVASGDGATYTLEPVCSLGGTAVCQEAATCFENGEEGLLYDVFRDGVDVGSTCLTETQAEELGEVTPGRVLREFQRIQWPESPLIVQPPNGRTLVNFATNFYTDNTEPSTQTVRLLGQQVTIEATPSEYVWQFDDGTADQVTTSAGSAYPALEITHDYLTVATVAPSVDTVYAGRFRINGGPWQQIPETLTVAGTPATLEIIEATPRLVG